MKTDRTIEEVLDLQRGDIINVDSFFSKLKEVEIFQLRTTIEKQINIGEPLFNCLYCHQPVVLRGRRLTDSTSYFFKHRYKSEDCIIKTTSAFTEEQIRAIKYNGVKESYTHKEMKKVMSEYLSLEVGSENVHVERVYRDSSELGKWRKPDILVDYPNIQVALELQLSTTFLTVIIERSAFYQKEGVFLVWVFNTFSKESDLQKFTQKDVYYNNKENVFIFDEEAKERTSENNKLLLKCMYKKYSINSGELEYKWLIEFISLTDLKYDSQTFECYYKDCDKERNELQSKLNDDAEKEKEKLVLKRIEEEKALERKKLREEEDNEHTHLAIEYFKKIYHSDTVPHEYDPLDSMSSRVREKLNGILKLSSDNSDVIRKRFTNNDKPNFVKYISLCDNLYVNYNVIEIENEPMLCYVFKQYSHSDFDHYVACLFARIYSIGYKVDAFLKNVYEINKSRSNNIEIENIRKWGVIELLKKSNGINSFEIVNHQRILLTIESLKRKVIIGDNCSSFVQLTHNFLDTHSEFSDLYIGALYAYKMEDFIKNEDKSGEIESKLHDYRKSRHYQDRSIYRIVKQLFPSMNL